MLKNQDNTTLWYTTICIFR